MLGSMSVNPISLRKAKIVCNFISSHFGSKDMFLVDNGTIYALTVFLLL